MNETIHNMCIEIKIERIKMLNKSNFRRRVRRRGTRRDSRGRMVVAVCTA